MNRLTDEVRQEALWTTMIADNIVICSEYIGIADWNQPA